MSEQKIIAVLGATGAQGGGLCRALLADSSQSFACRAITRDPGQDKAKALADQGVEVVKADLDDPASLERAFAGAHGVYGVTPFWEHFSGARETAQAKNLADAARVAGVRHVIWSTLEDTRSLLPDGDERMPILQDRYRVPHFDAKAEADRFFADLPVTYLITSYYWENLYKFGLAPKRDAEGYSWAFPMGDARLAAISAEDIGGVALGIFKAGEPYVGRRVGIYSQALTLEEMGQALSKVLGVGPIRYTPVDADGYRSLGFPGADELGNMFQIYRDFENEVLAARNPDEARQLNPALQSFEQVIEKNREPILAAMNGQ
jgi:uncharacterized protein YbjT (DUF2867 family)